MDARDHQNTMNMFILGAKANQVQALHMADIVVNPERRISWTYLPSNVKRSLRPMIDGRFLEIVKAPVEGEPQVYEWLMLTKTGVESMRKELRLL